MLDDERKFARLDSVGKIQAAIAALDAFIADLEKRNVEPDAWEQACCGHALSSLVLGKSVIAMHAVRLAAIPKEARLMDETLFGERIPFTRTELRLGLQRIRETLDSIQDNE